MHPIKVASSCATAASLRHGVASFADSIICKVLERSNAIAAICVIACSLGVADNALALDTGSPPSTGVPTVVTIAGFGPNQIVGTFSNHSTDEWVESHAHEQETHTFVSLSESDSDIVLFDRSRNMFVDLDVTHKIVKWRYGGQTPWNVIYAITDVSGWQSAQQRAEYGRTSRHWVAVGDAKIADKDINSAISSYADALEVDRNNPDAYIQRGAAYDLLGETDKALADYERALQISPNLPYAAGDVHSMLANDYVRSSRWVELERLSRAVLEARKRVSSVDDPIALLARTWLATALQGQGRLVDAENIQADIRSARSHAAANRVNELLQSAAMIRGTKLEDAGAANNIAHELDDLGLHTEAERLNRRALSIAEAIDGPESGSVALYLNNLAVNLSDQGRPAEAVLMLRRAIAIQDKLYGPDAPQTSVFFNNLASALQSSGLLTDAEQNYRRSLAINERAHGTMDTGTAVLLHDLAGNLKNQNRFEEAEKLLRQALGILERTTGELSRGVAMVLSTLADDVEAQGRYVEAEQIYRRSMAVWDQFRGVNDAGAADLFAALGRNLINQQRYSEAALNLRRAQVIRVNVAENAISNTGAGKSSNAAFFLRESSETLGEFLWTWARAGGGSQVSDRPISLSFEAFEAAQRSVLSAAGDALARSEALVSAASTGMGVEAEEYEAALAERDELDSRFASVVADNSTGAVTDRQILTKLRDEVIGRTEQLREALRLKAPSYWNYRSPEPVGVKELQAPGTALSPELLHSDEALVLWMYVPGKVQGLVFAVSKTKFGWAAIGINGDDLKAMVQSLRADIDPEGYATRSATTFEGSESRANHAGFDRQAAHNLYMALLGSPAIQNVIKDKATLLFVPSGPLTSLPPGLLVVSEPHGGQEGRTGPQVLRETHWLIEDKAIAVLPAVSSLRTLRQLIPKDRAPPTVPLLELADPDFAGTGHIPAPAEGLDRSRSVVLRAADAQAGGRSKQEVLSSLPPLGGTRAEGEVLKSILSAPSDSLLLGPAASKTELDIRQRDGRLAKVSVLGFATHGLLTGDFIGLTEPALALAHPPEGADPTADDGLLRASDAAKLTLNADWVILSACNTASPNAVGAEGLSGLASAFFYAGAKSMLVSHWRIRDDAAERLVTETFRLQHGGAPSFARGSRLFRFNANPPPMSKAQALRIAMLELLEDRSQDPISSADMLSTPHQSFANPVAWAPFVVVGEAR